MSITESEEFAPISNVTSEEDSVSPVVRSRTEYEEYFYEKMEAAIYRVVAFFVEHCEQIESWKYWVALEPHQQQLIMSSLRNKYPPDEEQTEADDDNIMYGTAQSLFLRRCIKLLPRESFKSKKVHGPKGSLLYKATQGDKMMRDNSLSSGDDSTD